MSLGYNIAIHAVPFFDVLDREVKAVAEAVFGPEENDEAPVVEVMPADGVASRGSNPQAIAMAMETSRRHLAQAVDAFIRRLPAAVRNDGAVTRAAAYALVGLADERMLHYPAGGLAGWRERLLESELYGSALAGQEIIRQARNATQGDLDGGDSRGLLAALYLAILREGFEGSLRGDVLGLSTLTSTLEDTVGALRAPATGIASDSGPRRFGIPTRVLAGLGIALWLVSGVVFWAALGGDALHDANRIAERIEAGLASRFEGDDPRSIAPTRLPPPESRTSRDRR